MAKVSPLRRMWATLAGVALISTALFTAPATAAPENTDYLVGAGMYDVTGAVAETGSFGYASGQEMDGLHTRLYSRAFITVDKNTGKRAVLVSIDTGAIFPNIRLGVLDRLQAKYGALYNSQNVMLSATHTHVGNGGMAVEMLYRIASNDGANYNYDQRIVDVMINGIVESISRAHNNLQPGTIELQQGELVGATRNRSLPAYEANPDAKNYRHAVDTGMTQLAFYTQDGKPLGIYNWFSTHPTSFSIDWTKVSGDNKGYAQYAFERAMNTNPADPSTFVAAFSNSATGDVVATQGNAKSAPDYRGLPDDYKNAEIHGNQQFTVAKQLFDQRGTKISGPIDSRARYVKMPGYKVSAKYTDGAGEQKLCVSARGYSFAPGGENGPSNVPGVYEGMTRGNFSITDANNKIDQSVLGALVRMAGRVIAMGDNDPCQAEKPILIPDGKLGWTPTVLPFQMIQIGNVAIAAGPIEATTMASRHLKKTVADSMEAAGVDTVVWAGMSNAYAGYITTREEYAMQHYEGASTEFGPYQLAAFEQEFDRLGQAIVGGYDVQDEALPQLPNTKTFLQRPGVVFDDKPLRQQFGQVLTQPNPSYARGETARAEFRGAHPKNDFRTMGTFLKVQRLENGQWVDYLSDYDWDTTYQWKREGAAYSRTTVEWRIRENTAPGTYRLVQLGNWKNGWNGRISEYVGYSNPFTVN
ncbi:MAG: neutral/alkaline non-lysosomal ceramidase N-terminal domain-containing protein [Arcanobacterium sp.]|nr:neutral/alkaline non-lysosomal ceramidase N-terminal domain-containing protein [Arcanobacterium sp.]